MSIRRPRRPSLLIVLAVALAALGLLSSYFINLVSNDAPDLLKKWALAILLGLAVMTLLIAGWSAKLSAGDRTPERRVSERRQVIARVAAATRASLDETFAFVPRLPLQFSGRPDLARPGRAQGQARVHDEDLHTIFVTTGRSLLVLGAGGGGKSVLLAELCLRLCEGEAADPRIPVLLDLTTWSGGDNVEQWLAQAIVDAYPGVAADLAAEWVGDRAVILLLDGLDEVPTQKDRQKFLTALGRFLEAGPCSVVLSCRSDAFAGLEVPETLSYAVEVRTPSRDQVRRYLADLRNPAADAANAVDERDKAWWSLIREPIMLGIVARLSATTPRAELVIAGSSRHRRRHIISLYVDALLRRGPERTPRYRPEDARRWLAWLATWMRGRRVLHIDRLPPAMTADLLDPRHRKARSLAYVTRMCCAAFTVGLLANTFIAPFSPFSMLLNAAPVVVMTWVNINKYHLSPTQPIRLVWNVRGRWVLWSSAAIGASLLVVALLSLQRAIDPTVSDVVLFTAATSLLNIPAVLAFCIAPVGRPNAVGLPPGARLARSRRAATWGAVLGLALAGARGVLSGTALHAPIFALSTTLPFAVICASSCWLIFGGVPVLQYRMLFHRFRRTGRGPADYPAFLNWARRRLLLQASGSALRFPHKEIQRYFEECW